MANPNEREIHNQEVRQESYTDANGNTHTHLTRNTSTTNNSYESGYLHGRNVEHRYQQADLVERDNENAASGLILGALITSLIGLTIGAFWYFNQQNAAVDSTAPIETPASPSVEPTPINTPPQPQQTTIIERTREVPVVIPQPAVTASPKINITVPPQQSRTEPLPTVTPTNPPSINNRNNSSTNTPVATTSPSPSPTASPQTIESPQGESNSSLPGGNTNQNSNSAP